MVPDVGARKLLVHDSIVRLFDEPTIVSSIKRWERTSIFLTVTEKLRADAVEDSLRQSVPLGGSV